EMQRLSDAVENQIRQVPEVNHIGRRIGRAERSDHVVPLSNVEFDIDFKKTDHSRDNAAILADLRQRVQSVPGTFSVISGPLSHRIGHLLSGVTAPVAVKIFGPDLDTLTRIGKQVQQIAQGIPGLEDAKLDHQASIPQLRIEVDRERALAHGITPGELNRKLSTLLGGAHMASLREDQRSLDLVIRLPEDWRTNPSAIPALPIATPSGRHLSLGSIAEIREAVGPSAVCRENTQRRYAISIQPTQCDARTLV